MYAFVARQAVLDSKANVFGYELLFRDGPQNCYPDNIDPDEATSKLITGSHLAFGVEEITFGKPAFINFTNRSSSEFDSERNVDFPVSKNTFLKAIELPILMFFNSIVLSTKLSAAPFGISKFSEWNKYPFAFTAIP